MLTIGELARRSRDRDLGSFEIVIDLKPEGLRVNAALKRTRTGVRKSGKAAGAQAEIGELAQDAWNASGRFDPLEGPVDVEIAWFSDKAHKSGPAEGQARMDVDGPIKGILDSLEGVIYANDAQVNSVSTRKGVGKPRIEIKVWRP